MSTISNAAKFSASNWSDSSDDEFTLRKQRRERKERGISSDEDENYLSKNKKSSTKSSTKMQYGGDDDDDNDNDNDEENSEKFSQKPHRTHFNDNDDDVSDGYYGDDNEHDDELGEGEGGDFEDPSSLFSGQNQTWYTRLSPEQQSIIYAAFGSFANALFTPAMNTTVSIDEIKNRASQRFETSQLVKFRTTFEHNHPSESRQLQEELEALTIGTGGVRSQQQHGASKFLGVQNEVDAFAVDRGTIEQARQRKMVSLLDQERVTLESDIPERNISLIEKINFANSAFFDEELVKKFENLDQNERYTQNDIDDEKTNNSFQKASKIATEWRGMLR
jgi:hypothetical protein